MQEVVSLRVKKYGKFRIQSILIQYKEMNVLILRSILC